MSNVLPSSYAPVVEGKHLNLITFTIDVYICCRSLHLNYMVTTEQEKLLNDILSLETQEISNTQTMVNQVARATKRGNL